jgi:hypothetical protein
MVLDMELFDTRDNDTTEGGRADDIGPVSNRTSGLYIIHVPTREHYALSKKSRAIMQRPSRKICAFMYAKALCRYAPCFLLGYQKL